MKPHQETTFGTIFRRWPVKPLPDVAFFQEGPGLRKWQWTESGMKVINVTNILGDGSVDVAKNSGCAWCGGIAGAILTALQNLGWELLPGRG